MTRVNILEDGTGHIIIFPYDPVLLSKLKTTPGQQWCSTYQYGSFPDIYHTLERILNVFSEGNVFFFNCFANSSIPRFPSYSFHVKEIASLVHKLLRAQGGRMGLAESVGEQRGRDNNEKCRMI